MPGRPYLTRQRSFRKSRRSHTLTHYSLFTDDSACKGWASCLSKPLGAKASRRDTGGVGARLFQDQLPSSPVALEIDPRRQPPADAASGSYASAALATDSAVMPDLRSDVLLREPAQLVLARCRDEGDLRDIVEQPSIISSEVKMVRSKSRISHRYLS